MDKKQKKFSKKELDARLVAYNEAAFSADDLTLEVEPLIKSYFVGEFERTGNSINCEFLNGQKFCIKVEEIK